jgi:hypothetical protein
MGPSQNPARHPENQERPGRKGPPRRPRTRRCLLKGCEERFRPRQGRQRYCSEQCRMAAREWSRWRAQQRYRVTGEGREKRNGQSCRYRKRARNRKQPPREEAVPEAARVITKDFFRTTAVTAPAAMKGSIARRDRPCSDSARTSAGARWSASGNASGTGNGHAPADRNPASGVVSSRWEWRRQLTVTY